ncbi:hypothetical protein AMTRI_Chr12g236760 [Amborella trichopoda]
MCELHLMAMCSKPNAARTQLIVSARVNIIPSLRVSTTYGRLQLSFYRRLYSIFLSPSVMCNQPIAVSTYFPAKPSSPPSSRPQPAEMRNKSREAIPNRP